MSAKCGGCKQLVGFDKGFNTIPHKNKQTKEWCPTENVEKKVKRMLPW